ncbi:MAG: MATE family efflux transporter [Muribaculaceae bacterium]|nr:MATE family efflux transporter [Roseburia sp.]MCM1430114.1 MATE family efflux transporter [Muribaculaceae bacterium]MCM1492179.1 MATE family efflux transporter [Muribaculaceae bacterium]
MEAQKKTLTQLFVPICFETLFLMLTGMVDTLMLSSVSDNAVGAVGTANTYIGVFIIMFSVISTGMMTVMTQNIGAGRTGVAYQARQLGFAFNAVMGILMSVFLSVFAGNILHLVGVAPALMEPAAVYLKIVGGGCILPALIPIFSGYLRAFGFTKQSLAASIVGNLTNFALNAFFLFVVGWGVRGVAIATVISRVVNLLLVVFMGHLLVHAKESPERMANRKVFAQIVKVGLPSACESALYNLAMTLVIRFMNQMDAEGINVTARSYTMQIANFSYCVGAALAQANAIMTGWRIGAKDFPACEKGTRKAAIIGVITASCVETVFALSANVLVGFFTDDPQMIALVGKLLFVDIVLEMGRVTNLVYGQALKTSGDAVFPVVLGVIFMFLCAVGGTWLFGMKLQLYAVGAYIGMAGDECVRAIGMMLRWKSGRWKTKRLVE